ncbi:unnamed protein product [Protopolystoma xenopodis]|uniref:Uncharacterized protein n=1 Tax=Protopolystoma xenopodis TaxID=117903 RepID=A0A3S5BAB9_9PLAT|nr:unnamed protein product [Protopolystoma xenopodis]
MPSRSPHSTLPHPVRSVSILSQPLEMSVSPPFRLSPRPTGRLPGPLPCHCRLSSLADKLHRLPTSIAFTPPSPSLTLCLPLPSP